MSEYLALEARVAALEQRQLMESRLRASVDLDLSALQEKAGVTLSLVQAVAVVQSDHSRRLTQVESTLSDHTDLHNQHTARFDGLEAKVDGLEAKVDGLEAKVDGLEAKLDVVQAGVAELLSRRGDDQGR